MPWEDNTVGSSLNIKAKHKWPMYNSIILGTILGDGYLNKYGALTLEHSIKQSDYI